MSKIRLGFVSNSSSSCFICGGWIGEDETYCDECINKKFSENQEKLIAFLLNRLHWSKEEALRYLEEENEN